MVPGRIAVLICLSKRGVAFERDGEHEQISGGAGSPDFLHPETLALAPTIGFDFFGSVSGAPGIPRSDDYGFAGARPAERQAEAFRAGAADDRDSRAILIITFGELYYANSGSSDSSIVMCSGAI